ncbi:MAG: hypothetical protein NTW49_14625 [Bacteroidia bacterium]|nr:hypothetical protein [Bacteroidia bacterium]
MQILTVITDMIKPFKIFFLFLFISLNLFGQNSAILPKEKELVENYLTSTFWLMFPVRLIYKMPSKKPSFLIIGSAYPNSNKFDDYDRIASLLILDNGKLRQGTFQGNLDLFYSAEDIGLSSDFDKAEVFRSIIKTEQKCPEPFIKYDILSNSINFLNLDCEDNYINRYCKSPYLKVISGTFEFRDSAFFLIKDSTWFYPSLESLTDTLKVKEYKIGNYDIKAIATEKYEVVGEGVLPILTVNYQINSQTIGYVLYEKIDKNKLNLLPDCRLQKDSSLIFLITNITNNNQRGMCGGCFYNTSEFWILRNNYSKKIFSFFSNEGSPFTTYEYPYDKSLQTGKFYLQKDSTNEENEWETDVDSLYWKNDSTYACRISGDHLFRNFYVHFDTGNNKAVAKLEVGELLKIKDIKR